MKKITPIFIVAALIAGFLWFNLTTVRIAPAVSLTDLNGAVMQTDNRQQRPLLITFWATSCVSCVKEIPDLIALQNDLRDQLDIAAVAMYYDPLENIRELIRRRNINYSVVFDSAGTIAQAFGGIKLTPTTFLISPTGEIVFQKIGDVDFAKLREDITLLLKTKTG